MVMVVEGKHWKYSDNLGDSDGCSGGGKNKNVVGWSREDVVIIVVVLKVTVVLVVRVVRGRV